MTWKLYKILFDSQRFASCNIYYLKTYASTECLKQTSTLQTFAFIMNWMKYHVVSSVVTYGSFFVSARAIKSKNTIVRNSFSAVVYTASNITHTIEKPIAELSVSSENFFPLVLHESAPFTVYYWDYIPFCTKWHFLQHNCPLQSQTTALLLHTMFRLQERKVWSV